MAFSSRTLSVLAFADGYTVWHYSTEDIGDDVRKPGYFDDARDVLRTRDSIEIYAADQDFSAVVSTAGRVRIRPKR